MLVAPCLERCVNPVSRWELYPGIDSKSLAAGIEPAVQWVEHLGQYPVGQLDHRLTEEPIQLLYRGSKKARGFYFLIAS
jgi:hypothetical protein